MNSYNVLCFSGLDPSGGAGLLADHEAVQALGAHTLSIITALTGQNSQGVSWVRALSQEEREAQLQPLLSDISIHAVKIGMLGSAELVLWLSAVLSSLSCPVVLDPVLLSSSGHPLLSEDGRALLCTALLPKTTLLTPNRDELFLLAQTSQNQGIEAAAEVLLAQGARAVLVKGGHAVGDTSVDVLFSQDGVRSFSAPRLGFPEGLHTVRGTGCRLASACAALLAQGVPLPDAVGTAKQWLWRRLQQGIQRLGQGPLGYVKPPY